MEAVLDNAAAGAECIRRLMNSDVGKPVGEVGHLSPQRRRKGDHRISLR
jgi:hypothetical protein